MIWSGLRQRLDKQPIGFSMAIRLIGAFASAITKSTASMVLAARSGLRVFQCNPELAK
jgi:hypothetical protein